MIRKLFLFSGGAFLVALVCLAGAAALVSDEVGTKGWNIGLIKDGDHVRIGKGEAGKPEPSTSKTIAWTGGDLLAVPPMSSIRRARPLRSPSPARSRSSTASLSIMAACRSPMAPNTAKASISPGARMASKPAPAIRARASPSPRRTSSASR